MSLWRPSKEFLGSCNLWSFMKKHGFSSYREFLKKSCEDLEWFWGEVSKELCIKWSEPYESVLENTGLIYQARWFKGGKFNICRSSLGRWAQERPNDLAVLSIDEEGNRVELTFSEVFQLSSRVAGFLEGFLPPGSRVGVIMPMSWKLIPVVFGIFMAGCVFVPAFTGYGSEALRARFSECGVKAVFTKDYIVRRGKRIALGERVREGLRDVGVERMVVDGRGGGFLSLDEVLFGDLEGKVVNVGSEDVAVIIYTSGTTGKPKGTVHTNIGTFLQVGKDTRFLIDLKPGERVFWMTDIGWMAAIWVILGSFINGSTLVLYDGAPDYPDKGRFFEILEEARVTVCGVTPTLTRLFMSYGINLGSYKLSLRVVGSGGEMWDEKSYLWLFEGLGGDVPIINMCGGTEVLGNMVSCVPVEEIKTCTVYGPSPGMDADVFDDSGRHVEERVGYLVCKSPFPSMTKGFVEGYGRFLESYFSKFENVWFHGDLAYIDEDGFWFIVGRADDVIKVAGKRLGPGEVEDIVNSHPNVLESAAVGVPDPIKGEVVVVFIVPKGEEPDKEEIKNLIYSKLGKGFTVKDVVFLDELPKTVTGKIARKKLREMVRA